MTEPSSAPQYQEVPRSNLHRAHARHPYAHHIRRLTATLRAMASDLEVPPGGRLLDYGCADMPYRGMFSRDVDYVGADLPGNPGAKVLLNPDGTLPVADQTCDAVLSTQVLEHVLDPERYLAECFRVLRPGGRLLLSTHGVFAYHPDPMDLWRWTGEGLRRQVQAPGFEVLRVEGVIGLAATGLQLFQDALSYRVPKRCVPWLAFVLQKVIAFVDRFETAQSLGYNAQVFVVVAGRPA